MISSDADLRLPLRSLRSRFLGGAVIQGRSSREMPQLRQEGAAPHLDPGHRLQGIGLVQDGQPAGREGVGREQLQCRQEERHEERDEVRCEERDQERNEERREEGRNEGAGEAGAEERRGILTPVRALVRDARAVATSFLEDECPFLAGAVAYQLFFALIPLLALVVGILGFLYGSERAQQELVQLIRDVYPSATAQETRIARQLVGGLAVLSFAVSYGVLAAEGALASVLGPWPRVVVGLLSPLFGLVAGYVLFYAIYRLIPRSRVQPRTARLAALVSAVLWEVAKVAFGFFTRSLGIFSAYGPIAFAAGLLTWIYVTAMIIFIGAEVIKLRRA